MFRLILPPCLAVLVQAWGSPRLARLHVVALRANIASSRVFDDDEELDLGSSDENGLAAPLSDVFPEIVSFFDDDQCLDLCPAEDQQPAPEVGKDYQVVSNSDSEMKVERDRIRLEMAFELFQSRDDCDLADISTCASLCDVCLGKGCKPCRFCIGEKSISLVGAKLAMPCPVCNQKGVEVCTKCRGSGQVASWTELSKFNPGDGR